MVIHSSKQSLYTLIVLYIDIGENQMNVESIQLIKFQWDDENEPDDSGEDEEELGDDEEELGFDIGS